MNIQKVLFFDTTIDYSRVELFTIHDSDFSMNYQWISRNSRDASTELVWRIQEGLIQSSFEIPDILFCPTGPGLFTGIRLTVAIARNLVQFWKVPCLAVTTTELYLRSFLAYSKQNCVILIDGKQGKYFYQKYESGLLSPIIEKQKEGLKDMVYDSGDLIILDKELDLLKQRMDYSIIRDLGSIPEAFLYFSKSMAPFNNYDSIIPNYIRGSYVDHGPIQNTTQTS